VARIDGKTKSCRSVVSKRLGKRQLAVMGESLGWIADRLVVYERLSLSPGSIATKTEQSVIMS
jgi:hypothetical protein